MKAELADKKHLRPFMVMPDDQAWAICLAFNDPAVVGVFKVGLIGRE